MNYSYLRCVLDLPLMKESPTDAWDKVRGVVGKN